MLILRFPFIERIWKTKAMKFEYNTFSKLSHLFFPTDSLRQLKYFLQYLISATRRPLIHSIQPEKEEFHRFAYTLCRGMRNNGLDN